MDEIVHEFLVESYENLDQLDRDLVALEGDPESRDLLGSVFRTIHTIKGTSGFLALSKLEKVTHAGENLLVELRAGRRSMDQPTTNVLLRLVDTVRAILGNLEAGSGEGDVPIDEVVAVIEAVLAGEVTEVSAPEAAGDGPVPTAEGSAAAPAGAAAADAADAEADADAADADADDVAEADADDDDEDDDGAEALEALEAPDAADAAAAPAATPTPAQAPTPEPTAATPTSHPHAGTEVAAVPGPKLAPPAEKPATKSADEHREETGGARAADTSIRVDVDLLDALMRQVGELVLARNQITRLADGNADLDFVRASQRLSLIASELQEGVMKTRMQPIDHLWSKMPRIVRDLAAACGRQVQLEMVGGDTELDRSLLEAVKDPLTHLVRNAVDHGIESPADRTAAGKAPRGTLTLRAYHAGGQVVVEVSDDGKGIDPVIIGAKAVERGLRRPEQIDAMAPADILQMLFLPGFSTAEKVTNVSGRGVGMDVVKTKIEGIGGAVDVDSVVGRGTTWRLRIPLTLAIMPALTVESAQALYAIPQVSLLELVALDPSKASSIEFINNAPVYRLRGTLLPLVTLREVLGAEAGDVQDSTVIAVLQADTRRFGLVLDRVLNTEEIVVKPLSARLKSIGLFAGATLLGDGRVSLILDVQAIARRALITEPTEAAREAAAAAAAAAATKEAEQVLIAGIGDGRRVAIPLAAVTRLERVARERVERVGGREVIQYRGAIVPVARLDRLLGAYGSEEAEELLIVVYSRGDRSVAIVVDQIVDIVEDDGERHSRVGDSGLVGSTVLKDRVTELLDVEVAVLAADPTFFDTDDAGLAGETDPGAVGVPGQNRELVGAR